MHSVLLCLVDYSETRTNWKCSNKPVENLIYELEILFRKIKAKKTFIVKRSEFFRTERKIYKQQWSKNGHHFLLFISLILNKSMNSTWTLEYTYNHKKVSDIWKRKKRNKTEKSNDFLMTKNIKM